MQAEGEYKLVVWPKNKSFFPPRGACQLALEFSVAAGIPAAMEVK